MISQNGMRIELSNPRIWKAPIWQADISLAIQLSVIS
jgi:hypothetical protein